MMHMMHMFAVDPDTSSSSAQVYVLHVVCLLGNENLWIYHALYCSLCFCCVTLEANCGQVNRDVTSATNSA